MSRWGQALAGAAGAMANVGVQAIDRDMKLADQLAAEQRAADLKLSLAERTMAMEEAMRTRAAERFAAVTKGKLAEPVPLEAQTVDQTGITSASAAPTDPMSVSLRPENIAEAEKILTARANSPALTEEEREEARMALEQLERQKSAQGDLNAKAVEGKTRARTVAEARDAALEETATSDPGAMMAGRSMWGAAMADERSDKKDKAAAGEKDADRASREKIAAMQADTRRDIASAETARKTEADKQRAELAKSKAEALAGGKGAKATALMQNYTFLTEKLGKSPEQAEKVLFQAKDSSEAEKVFKLMLADKFDEKTVEQHFADVRGIGAAAGGGNGDEKIPTWNPKTGKFE